MAILTVKDLIEELDAYGGHLPVKVRLNYGEEDEQVLPLDLDDTTHDGEIVVVIGPE